MKMDFGLHTGFFIVIDISQFFTIPVARAKKIKFVIHAFGGLGLQRLLDIYGHIRVGKEDSLIFNERICRVLVLKLLFVRYFFKEGI